MGSRSRCTCVARPSARSTARSAGPGIRALSSEWIGHAAIIKPEVKIGHGAVVASGAIVTKDVAPYTIVAGVTAQPIRRRFSEQVSERLLALAWWDWNHDRLRDVLPDFRALHIEAFLEKYE